MVKGHGKNNGQYKKVDSHRFITYKVIICKFCTERNFRFVKKNVIKYKTSVKITTSRKNECHVCNNLIQKTIIPIQNDILNSDYFINDKQNIKKIDIGTSLPLFLFEKEDSLRSLFKIKGLPNIKNHYNNLLRKEIIKGTENSIDHLNPDIRIQISIDSQFNYEIKYITKSLILLGTYNKYKRGLCQRFNIINIKEKLGYREKPHLNSTIEDTILEYLHIQSGSKNIKIAWSGSEDKDSLVLGNGRPFIVNIYNPTIRNIQKTFDIKGELRLIFQEVQREDMHIYNQYKISIKTVINILEDSLDNVDLEKSVANLVGEIKFQIKKKIIKKKVYSTSYRILDNKNFEMRLLLDNGIPIKQLIGGKEYIEPCLSNLINRKCECVIFDIDDIIYNN